MRCLQKLQAKAARAARVPFHKQVKAPDAAIIEDERVNEDGSKEYYVANQDAKMESQWFRADVVLETAVKRWEAHRNMRGFLQASPGYFLGVAQDRLDREQQDG